MLLKVLHETTYTYNEPVRYGLLQLRLTPLNGRGQEIREWETEIIGGKRETTNRDHFGNKVELVRLCQDANSVTIKSEGLVRTSDTSGILGKHYGLVPLWLFTRQTERTNPGQGIRELIQELREQDDERDGDGDDVALLHRVSARIRDRMAYEPGQTDSSTTAEDALASGSGVCQDHSHVFLAVTRGLGYPARYVTGYLFTESGDDHSAGHAWAEAHLSGLGWIGFDVSNGISPDERYVRVARGLDSSDAAPINGIRQGDGGETMHVRLQVQQ